VQQAPVGGGWGHRFGLQVAPSTQTLGNTHSGASVTVQAPSVAQQDPVGGGGGGHGFGSQVVHSACQSLPGGGGQNAWTMSTQDPSVQQAPVGGGWGQGFGLQVAPSTQTFGNTHSSAAVTVQAPSVAQQAPVGGGGGGHGFGMQVVHSGCQSPTREHAPCPEIVHPPAMQHAPSCSGCRQRFGTQAPPGNHTFGSGHSWAGLTVQLPSGAQQDPVGGGGGGIGHRLGEHVDDSWYHSAASNRQAVSGMRMQAPRVQQAPIGGAHRVVRQAIPGTQMPRCAHSSAVVSVHVPFVAQHAPII
jgi:hypothetical protein